MSCLCIFFFKQKTAYEMRISDWSSDVCSSDLAMNEVRYAAVFANALRASFSTLSVPSATDDLYPLSAKPLGSRDANGFGRTRDNGDFSVQTAHGSLLVLQVRPATASTRFTSKP